MVLDAYDAHDAQMVEREGRNGAVDALLRQQTLLGEDDQRHRRRRRRFGAHEDGDGARRRHVGVEGRDLTPRLIIIIFRLKIVGINSD